jgi:hypothetical protein
MQEQLAQSVAGGGAAAAAGGREEVLRLQLQLTSLEKEHMVKVTQLERTLVERDAQVRESAAELARLKEQYEKLQTKAKTALKKAPEV